MKAPNGKTLAQNLFKVAARLWLCGNYEGARIVFNSAKKAALQGE